MAYQLFSPHEKLRIIEEVKFNGVVCTCQKYGINPMNYYNWLKKVETGEFSALSVHKKKKNNNFSDELVRENKKLKKTIEKKDKEIQKYLVLVNDLFSNSQDVYEPKLTVNIQ